MLPADPGMTPLASLIAPLSVDDFRREVSGQHARHFPGPPSRHAHLFGWSALEQLLNTAPTPHPGLRIYRGDAGFVSVGAASEAIAHLRAGAGLILGDADRYSAVLGRFLDGVEAELDETARFNVYASTPAEAGFPLHADTHDVFVLQIAGQKHWKVCEPTLRDPLFHASLTPQPPTTGPYLEQTLSPGEVLYVPRGHWHEAAAIGGPSLHLTLAVFFSTGIDLLYHLTERLHGSEAFRAAFPLHSAPPWRDRSSPASHTAHLGVLREALLEALDDPQLLSNLRDARLGARQPRQPFAFPAHSAPALSPDARLIRPNHAVQMGARSGFFEMTIPGRRLRFPLAAEPLLDRIFATESISERELGEAVPDADPQLIHSVLVGLVAEGVLRVR